MKCGWKRQKTDVHLARVSVLRHFVRQQPTSCAPGNAAMFVHWVSSPTLTNSQPMAYLEIDGGGQGVLGTEVPQWGSGAISAFGGRSPPESEIFL